MCWWRSCSKRRGIWQEKERTILVLVSDDRHNESSRSRMLIQKSGLKVESQGPKPKVNVKVESIVKVKGPKS